MKDKDFSALIELTNDGGIFVPINENAQNLVEMTGQGESIWLMEVTARDLNRHKCYMSLLAFIWGYLPQEFKTRCPKSYFYKWLKHLKKNYEIVFSFRDSEKKEKYVRYLTDNKNRFRLSYKSINEIAEFTAKSDMIEYESIAFGNMSEKRFQEYIKEQLPWIYEVVIGAFFTGDVKDNIIQTIEDEYEKFFAKL